MSSSKTYPNDFVTQDPCECPTCGRDDFKSREGMKRHHYHIHGESIAGEEYDCSYCDGTFRTEPSTNKKFCSDQCRKDWKSENLTGTDNPNCDGKVERECHKCGASITVAPWRSEASVKMFCSGDCQSSWISNNRIKENNPNWNGGALQHKHYGPNWFNRRTEIIEGQDGLCRICRSHRDDLDRDLEVHHVTPLKQFKDSDGVDWERANDPDNLVALCHSCHQKWEGIPVVAYGASLEEM